MNYTFGGASLGARNTTGRRAADQAGALGNLTPALMEGSGPGGQLTVLDMMLAQGAGYMPTAIGQTTPFRPRVRGIPGLGGQGPGRTWRGGMGTSPGLGAGAGVQLGKPRMGTAPIAGMGTAFNPGQIDPSKIGRRLEIPGQSQQWPGRKRPGMGVGTETNVPILS